MPLRDCFLGRCCPLRGLSCGTVLVRWILDLSVLHLRLNFLWIKSFYLVYIVFLFSFLSFVVSVCCGVIIMIIIIMSALCFVHDSVMVREVINPVCELHDHVPGTL